MKIPAEIGKLDHDTLDHLLEGFQLIGFDWKYLYVNSSVVKQSKYNTKEELLGFTMMEKYPGIEKTELFKTLQNCMTSRLAVQFENEFTFPDNTKGWFELRIEPVPEGIFILSIDITERKKSEEEAMKYVNGLKEMLFMTSHKVRMPVSNILGISKLLESEVVTQEELNKIAGYMKESAVLLDSFTKELTTYMHDLKPPEQN